MALTLMHDRRQKALRKRDITIKDITHRACKRSGIILDASTPVAVVSALEKYIEDLRDIEAELKEKYPTSERQLWRIGLEIRNAVEAIARAKIEQVRPGR